MRPESERDLLHLLEPPMISSSESVNLRNTSITSRRTCRRGLALPLRLFLEELEPRCVLSDGVLLTAGVVPGSRPSKRRGTWPSLLTRSDLKKETP